MFNTLRNCQTFTEATQFYTSMNIVQGFQFLHILTNMYYFSFIFKQCGGYKELFHFGFDFISYWLVMVRIFLWIYWPFL